MIAKASQIRTLGEHQIAHCFVFSSLHQFILFLLQSKGQISLITDSTVFLVPITEEDKIRGKFLRVSIMQCLLRKGRSLILEWPWKDQTGS